MTYIYIRVSSKEQAVLGHSLEAQAMKCIRYAERHGLTLGPESNSGRPGVFVDAGTSSDKKKSLANRVGGHEMLKAIRPGDTVLITSPSRIWRNLYHSEAQLRAWAGIGVSLRCVDLDLNFNSANGRIVLQIMCAVAEWNNRIRSERTKEGLMLRGRSLKQPSLPAESSGTEQTAQPTLSPTWAATQNAIASFEADPTPFTGVVRAYCRVSTATQDEQAQVVEIERRLRATPGMESVVIEWYCDHGVSAYKKRLADRPQGRKLLKELQPGDMVVSLRVDRLIRSLQEMAIVMKQIHDRGSFVWFLDTDLRTDVKEAELMLTILAFAAEAESREASRAILAGQHMARLKGRVVTSTPNCMKVLPWDGHTFKRSCSGGVLAILPAEVQVEAWFRLYDLVNSAGLGTMVAARQVCDELSEAYGLPRIEPYRLNNPATSHQKFKRINYSPCLKVEGMDMPYLISHLDKMDEEFGLSEYRARMRVWAEAMFKEYGYQEFLTYFFCDKKFLSRNLRYIAKYLLKSGLNREGLKRAVMSQATDRLAIPPHVKKLQQILS